MPLISRDQKDLENTQTRGIAIKSVFMSEIYDLRQEISLVRSQLKQEKLFIIQEIIITRRKRRTLM